MRDTLTSRMVVNVVGIPAIIAIVYLGEFYFAIFVTLASILALTEFYRLARLKDVSPVPWVGWLACVVIAVFYYRGTGDSLLPVAWHELLVTLVLLVAIFELGRNRQNATSNISTTMAGILYVPLLLGTLIGIRQIDLVDYAFGMRLTLGLFFSVWLCDSAAYAFGKKWGKKKILERVSPKKTVTGTLAGIVIAVVAYVTMVRIGFLAPAHSTHSLSMTDAVILGVIVGVFGQAGDFVESLMKRDVGVKDSGRFLMGHGGVLDRFDSLIVASPLTYLYLNQFVF
ncbi:MAG: phosphatidate cytidylyltransferase [Fidelibacterota bacterium]